MLNKIALYGGVSHQKGIRASKVVVPRRVGVHVVLKVVVSVHASLLKPQRSRDMRPTREACTLVGAVVPNPPTSSRQHQSGRLHEGPDWYGAHACA